MTSDINDEIELGSAPTVSYINEAGVPDDVLSTIRSHRDVASVIERWSRSLHAQQAGGPRWDVFGREQYGTDDHIFAQMKRCTWAVENDDVLSTLADVSEALAFNKVRFEMNDADQQDIWNQWAALVDLDSRMREIWRELFKVSQVYVGLWWERREFQVRTSKVRTEVERIRSGGNPGRGNRTRRRTFNLMIPTALTIFDPTKVVPVGSLMFNRQRYAYAATIEEGRAFDSVMGGDIVDDLVLRLVERKYTPSPGERAELGGLDINPDNLYLLRRDAVFRHSLTRAHYERWAPVRLKPALDILEMKQHLRASDRASLLGNQNFIVVIKKGSDRFPARPEEISNLQEQAKVVARMPILVGDHRLSVEIVSPALDNTLIESRWQVLDSRLVFKALQSFQPVVQGGNSAGSGVSEMSRVVSRGIESRRHEQSRSLEEHIFRRTVELNEDLDEVPGLSFTPKRVSLDFNEHVVQAVLKLRDRGDLSRETMLEEVDFDQDVEVLRRAREMDLHDDIFHSQVPHSSPGSNPFTDGNRGGRPPGVQEEDPRAPKNRPQ